MPVGKHSNSNRTNLLPLIVSISADQRVTNHEQRLALKSLAISLHNSGENGRGFFDNVGILLYYLQVSHWDQKSAETKMLNALKWREQLGVNVSGWHRGNDMDVIQAENATGKVYVRRFDREGRPIIYLRPGKENTFNRSKAILNFVYNLERAVACIEKRDSREMDNGRCPVGVGQFVFIVDFSGYSLCSGIPVRVIHDAINILSVHYPQRLAKIVMVNMPCVLRVFRTMVSPFLGSDSKGLNRLVCVITSRKAHRRREMAKMFDMQVVEASVGGDNHVPFDPAVYTNTNEHAGELGLDFDAQYSVEVGVIDIYTNPILRDPRMRELNETQHLAVLTLNRTLSANISPDESHEGLFDHAGSLIRYLVARQWNLPKAEAMIRETATWRMQFHHADMRAGKWRSNMAIESADNKLYVRGFDKFSRPIIYMKAGREFHFRETMTQHLVYNMERAVACSERQYHVTVANRDKTLKDDLTSPGKFCCLVDYTGFGVANMLSLRQATEMILIMQNHYPERLACLVLLDPPWLFQTLYNAVAPFADEATVRKVVFVSGKGEARSRKLSEIFHVETLETTFGGKKSVPFDSRIYMETSVDGTEFGLEFDEQVAMHKTRHPEFRELRSWHSVCSDEFVFQLPREERGKVRMLARSLLGTMSTTEGAVGLLDQPRKLLRYLKMCNWDLQNAEKRIRATAEWRKDFGVIPLCDGKDGKIIAEQNAAGSLYVRGYDRCNHPIIYIKLGNCESNCRIHDDFLKHVIYVMERTIACIDAAELKTSLLQNASDGKLVVIVNLDGYETGIYPDKRTLLEAVNILYTHYPERLSEIFLINSPQTPDFTKFWANFSTLLSAETRDKITFCKTGVDSEKLNRNFDMTQVERWAGGENDVPFASQVFLGVGRNENLFDLCGTEFNAQSMNVGRII